MISNGLRIKLGIRIVFIPIKRDPPGQTLSSESPCELFLGFACD